MKFDLVDAVDIQEKLKVVPTHPDITHTHESDIFIT